MIAARYDRAAATARQKGPTVRGVIKLMVRNKGFAFLRGEDGIERFFHASSVQAHVNFENLAEGDRVIFDEDRSPKGPRAKNVSLDPIGNSSDDPEEDTTTQNTTATKGALEKPVALSRKAKARIGASAHRRSSGRSLRTG